MRVLKGVAHPAPSLLGLGFLAQSLSLAFCCCACLNWGLAIPPV